MSAAAQSARRGAASTLAGWIIALALLALAVLFAADRLYNAEQFRIREVEVHGRFSHVDGARVKAVVEQSLPGNYFSLSLAAVEARIAQLPWVFSASVRRKWPHTLVVDVVEVQPVAKWGRRQWLNFTGDLVAQQPGASADERSLPVLSGPDSRRAEVWQAFRGWSEMFAANGLSLDELRFDARGLWYLQLSVGALARTKSATATATTTATATATTPVTLIVQREHAEERIARFVAALRARLIGDFAEMRSVDLRYPNGFAVNRTTAPEARLAHSEP